MASAQPSELIARIRAASIAAADAEAAEAGGGYQKSRPPHVRIAACGRVVRAPQKVPAERDVSALRDQRALGRLVRSLEHDGVLPRSPSSSLPRSPSSTLPRSPSAWPSSPTSAASSPTSPLRAPAAAYDRYLERAGIAPPPRSLSETPGLRISRVSNKTGASLAPTTPANRSEARRPTSTRAPAPCSARGGSGAERRSGRRERGLARRKSIVKTCKVQLGRIVHRAPVPDRPVPERRRRRGA